MAVSSEARPVAGKKLYIGTAMSPSDSLTNSSFTGQTWTLIDGWETQGKIGDARAAVKVSYINQARDVTMAGTKDAGAFSNNFIKLSGNAGQAALVAAQAAGANYAFKLEGNEAGATTVSQKLFVGVVLDTSDTGGGANAVDMMAANIQVNSNIVIVAAT